MDKKCKDDSNDDSHKRFFLVMNTNKEGSLNSHNFFVFTPSLPKCWRNIMRLASTSCPMTPNPIFAM